MKEIAVETEKVKRVYKFDSSDLQSVKNGHRQLLRMKDNGIVMIDLEWEIRLYEWMINHEKAASVCSQYMETRMASEIPLTKRETVEKLGWKIR